MPNGKILSQSILLLLASLPLHTITAAPAPPSTPDLRNSSDSGPSDTDNVTNYPILVFEGTSEPEAIINLYSDRQGLLDTETARADGTWRLGVNKFFKSIDGGRHQITATATNSNGEVSAKSEQLEIVYIAEPAYPFTVMLHPDSDTGISNSDNYTNDTTPTLIGTAFPNREVLIDEGGPVLFGTAIAGADGGWEFTLAEPLDSYQHPNFRVRTTDGEGYEWALSLGINVATTPPNLPGQPRLTATTDTGLKSDGVTAETRPTFAVPDARDNLVILYSDQDGEVARGRRESMHDYEAILTSQGALSPGVHNITAVAVWELYGNKSEPSSPLKLTIESLPPSPSDPRLHPDSDSGISNTDNNTNVTTPVFTGSAQPEQKVYLYSDLQGLLGSTSTTSTGEWTLTVDTDLMEGVHHITSRVEAIGGGLFSPSSAPLTLRIDTSTPAPSTPDLIPENDTGSSSEDNVTTIATPTFTGYAAPESPVGLLSNVDGQLGLTVSNTDGSWSIMSAPLSNGTHLISALGFDDAGNVAYSQNALLLEIGEDESPVTLLFGLDPASDNGTSSSDNLTNDLTPLFNGYAPVGATVELYSDIDGLIGLSLADASGYWEIQSGELSPGKHDITMTAETAVGELYRVPSTLSITLDQGLLEAITLALLPEYDSGVSDSDGITRRNQPVFHGSATPGTLLVLQSDLAGELGRTSVASDGTWRIAPTFDLQDGTHTMGATISDGAGNSVFAQIEVSIDTTIAAPPAPDLVSESDTGKSDIDNLTNDVTPTLEGKAEPRARVIIQNGGATLGVTQADEEGNWTFTVPTLNVHFFQPYVYLRVSQVDAAGNSSLPSPSLTVKLAAYELSIPVWEGGIWVYEDAINNSWQRIMRTEPEVPVEWSLLNDSDGKFEINATTGAFGLTSGTYLEVNEVTRYPVTFKAVDEAGNFVVQDIIIGIWPSPPKHEPEANTGTTDAGGSATGGGGSPCGCSQGTLKGSGIVQGDTGTASDNEGIGNGTSNISSPSGNSLHGSAGNSGGNEGGSSVSVSSNATDGDNSSNVGANSGVVRGENRSNEEGVEGDKESNVSDTFVKAVSAERVLDSPRTIDGTHTTAAFSAGATSDGGATTSTAFAQNAEVVIAGSVSPQMQDIGKAADIFVVIRTIVDGESTWAYRNIDGDFQRWSGRVSELGPAYEIDSLEISEAFVVYAGILQEASHRIFVGYMLRDGSGPLHYNGMGLPIEVE